MSATSGFCSIFLLSAVALAQKTGIPPRSAAADYPAATTQDGITLAAEVLPPAQAYRTFGSKKIDGYAVVEVAIYLEPGKSVDLAAIDFTLRLKGRASPIRPVDSRIVTAVGRRKPADSLPPKSNIDIYTTSEIGYSTGPVYGPDGSMRRGHGVYTESTVGVGIGNPGAGQPPPPAQDRDRDLEEDLYWKSLPPGMTSRTVAGYLYFPLPSKARADDARQLAYNAEAGTITVQFPVPKK